MESGVGGIGFKTEWTVAGDEAARTITLPLVESRAEGALSYNCIVDWGDDTTPSVVTSYNDVNRIHTYASNGTYEVEITGTMEGWSFNNAGDKLKITDIVNWGDTSVFDGFKYLKGGFYGCSNLASLGPVSGIIPASGTGVLTNGFKEIFRNCSSITTIPADLFSEHVAITTDGYSTVFAGCSSLTAIPAGLFDNGPLVTTNGFKSVFSGCSSLTAIPTDLFRYNTAVTSSGFFEAFANCSSLTAIPSGLFDYNTALTFFAFRAAFLNCMSLTAIPSGLFDYNTSVAGSAFYETFRGCTGVTAIPTDLFRYNILAAASAFRDTFRSCTALATVPADLFRYNTAVSTSGFYGTFRDCTALATVPADLFRYNTAVSGDGFRTTFLNCNKLQQNKNIFYQDGAQATRFKDQQSDFQQCFDRDSFTGTQGTAPDLWECDFGEEITLDVSPGTDWATDDIITGQTSGATAVVVSKTDATHYKIKKHVGTFQLDEIVGVTGVPAKLADQGAAHPTFAGGPTMTDCWEGAGNSGTSLDNYGDIPADWI